MKYMGSKSRIAKYIVPIIQKYIDDNNIENYLELFVGGANVIDKIKCKNRYGNDINKYLIALLKRVQDNGNLYDNVDKILYNDCRNFYQNKPSDREYENWEVGNIGFLSSYNGRFFDGGYAKTGIEKTKYGSRVRNYYEESKNNILNQNLSNIKFLNYDYKALKKNIKNYVIYLDPPYFGKKEYKNSKEFDYDYFWNFCRELSKNNFVFISEENAPEDFKIIWEQKVNRSIKANDKTDSIEKLFIYKGEK